MAMPSNPTTQTKSGFTWFQEWCGNVTASPAFEHLITALIILNAILLGMETYPALRDRFDGWMMLGNRLVVAVFVIEALMKLTAVAPRFNRYFADPWNQFDFLVVVFSLIPAAGPFATIARLGRLMRVLRLISAVPELRLIVTTLVRSIPSMGNVVLLMGLIFYVYAVLGQHFFHEVDPTHWATLGTAL